MTKLKMVELLIQRERELYEQLEVDVEIFGSDNGITKRDRTRWCVVSEILRELGLSE